MKLYNSKKIRVCPLHKRIDDTPDMYAHNPARLYEDVHETVAAALNSCEDFGFASIVCVLPVEVLPGNVEVLEVIYY